jgi:hypothetical protein
MVLKDGLAVILSLTQDPYRFLIAACAGQDGLRITSAMTDCLKEYWKIDP